MKMNRKSLTLLTIVAVTILLAASCASSFPEKEKVAAMTGEEATELLLDKTQEEIREHWGDPDSFFSGFYGDIYRVGDRCVGLYYDYDTKKVCQAACWVRQEIEKEIEGNIRTYYQMTDGSWMCEGYSYAYRLEVGGRMPNAAKDSTFTYLSNIEEITFEQAYKAAGTSSYSGDYFSPDEAVLVDMN